MTTTDTGATSVGLPLSAAQRGMWLDLQLHPERAPFYDIAEYVEIEGNFDVAVLERAIRFVVSRTASLRTKILARGHRVSQAISATMSVPIEQLDFRDAADPHDAATRWMTDRRRNTISPLDHPLFRFALLRLSGAKVYWYCQYHHMVIDGVGQKIFKDRVADAYAAMLAGQTPALDDDLSTFAAYVRYEDDYTASAQYRSDCQYWTRTPVGAVTLSVHRQTGTNATAVPHSCAMEVDAEILHALGGLARASDIGLQQFAIAATLLYLRRATGAGDMTIGLPTHGRVENWMRSMVAGCANVLPINFAIDDRATVADALKAVHALLGEALHHRRMRYDEIRRLQKVKIDDVDHFRIVINAVGHASDRRFGECPSTIRYLTPNYVGDLAIWLFTGTTGSLTLQLDANPARYESWEVDTHARNLLRFFDAMCAHASAPLKNVPPVDAAEALARAAPIAPASVATTSVEELIEAQADRNPTATALSLDRTTLTYADLDAQANRLAQALIGRGVAADDRIGVFFERSPMLPVAVLGVLKAGAAFLPLDPVNPPQRLRRMLADADPKIVLVSAALQGHEALDGRCTLLFETAIADAPACRPVLRARPYDLAYCIFTSGSSGQPKGVMIERRSMQNHVSAMAAEFGLTAADRVLQFFSIGFDQWIEEVFPAWICGATLVLQPERLLGIEAFNRFIEETRVSVLHLPVGYWHQWSGALAREQRPIPRSIRLVNVGGEKVQTESYRVWMKIPGAGAVTLVNTYGPTEAAVTATLYRVNEADRECDIAIGRPIANTRATVLDEHLQPVPVGVVGELCIGGAGVGRGYLNDAELTAARFVVRDSGGERIYRTGDRARYRADGNLEFLGRADAQVKIRGQRVELGEIEAALSGHPDVHQCAVVLPALAERPQLAVYVVTRDAIRVDASALQRFLAQSLPDYMVPSAFVEIDALPYTASGKVDRQNLSARAIAPLPAAEYVEPRTPLERAVATIWAEALQLDQVSATADFFALGGDSLTAVYVQARLEETTGAAPTLAALFQMRTVETLARALSEGIVDLDTTNKDR